jgi:hypothetical protein
MDIRVATLADAHILADLNADFNGVQMTPEHMAEQMLRCYDVERALIACIDGTAVGFACLRLIPWLCYDTPYAELTELFVHTGIAGIMQQERTTISIPWIFGSQHWRMHAFLPI